MNNYEYLEEEAIADVAFKAWGNTPSELFRNAGLATCNLQTNLEKLETPHKEEFKIEKQDLERLLKAFLGEILYFKDADLFFIKEISIEVKKTQTGWNAMGVFKGDFFNPEIHEMHNDLKAITYHNFYVKQLEQKRWECYVLIDI